MADDTQRSLGRLEAVQDTHNQRLLRIEEKLDHIVSVIDNARGGWRTLLAVGSVAGSIGAAIMATVHRIWP